MALGTDLDLQLVESEHQREIEHDPPAWLPWWSPRGTGTWRPWWDWARQRARSTREATTQKLGPSQEPPTQSALAPRVGPPCRASQRRAGIRPGPARPQDARRPPAAPTWGASQAPYQYAYGNPLKYVDPDGRSPNAWLAGWFFEPSRAASSARTTVAKEAKDGLPPEIGWRAAQAIDPTSSELTMGTPPPSIAWERSVQRSWLSADYSHAWIVQEAAGDRVLRGLQNTSLYIAASAGAIAVSEVAAAYIAYEATAAALAPWLVESLSVSGGGFAFGALQTGSDTWYWEGRSATAQEMLEGGMAGAVFGLGLRVAVGIGGMGWQFVRPHLRSTVQYGREWAAAFGEAWGPARTAQYSRGYAAPFPGAPRVATAAEMAFEAMGRRGRGYVSGFREIMAKARAAKAGDVQALGEIQAAKMLRAEGKNVHPDPCRAAGATDRRPARWRQKGNGSWGGSV